MIRNAGFRTFVLLLFVLLLAASPAMAAGKQPARQKAPSLVTWLQKALDTKKAKQEKAEKKTAGGIVQE